MKRAVLVILTIGLLAAPGCELLDIFKEKPEKEDVESKKIGAYLMCKNFVKDRMAAPGNAKFPPYTGDVSVSADGGDTYTVRSHVDSPARMRFVCTVRKDGETWHLKRLASR